MLQFIGNRMLTGHHMRDRMLDLLVDDVEQIKLGL